MTELPLIEKKILFFCPLFFGYEEEIVREMRRMGAEVTFRSAQGNEESWFKMFIRLFPKQAWKYADKYLFAWLDSSAPNHCDIVFIVKGEGLSPSFLKELRTRYPSAKFVLHLWDSISNCKNIDLKFKYFNHFSSFDPKDCDKLTFFHYRPLFFLDKFLNREPEQADGGLFFVGTLNGDRPKVIEKIVKNIGPATGFNYWLFIRSRFELSIRKFFDHSIGNLDQSRLLFVPMPHETIKTYLGKCSSVLDIEHPKQTGLTMRTFEVLASEKKLITTNEAIKNHNFYDPSRICVIDRMDPQIPADFFKSKLAPLPDSFITRYSLRGWLSEILIQSLA